MLKSVAISALLLAPAAMAVAQPAGSPVGTLPPAAEIPKVAFAFEERVTLGASVAVGETPYGSRNLVPITGGEIAGPKLHGTVLPYGWDWQLKPSDGCTLLSAEYFVRADDGSVIHILNTMQSCEPMKPGAIRSIFRPVFEAPKTSKYAWLNSGTFVAVLQVEGRPPAPTSPGSGVSAPRTGMPGAVRIRFYQIN